MDGLDLYPFFPNYRPAVLETIPAVYQLLPCGRATGKRLALPSGELAYLDGAGDTCVSLYASTAGLHGEVARHQRTLTSKRGLVIRIVWGASDAFLSAKAKSTESGQIFRFQSALEPAPRGGPTRCLGFSLEGRVRTVPKTNNLS